MFGLSFTHLILLAVIALVVLGPEQLPEVARTIARLLNEWRRATSDIQSSLVQTFRDEVHHHPPPAESENSDPVHPDMHAADQPQHHAHSKAAENPEHLSMPTDPAHDPEKKS